VRCVGLGAAKDHQQGYANNTAIVSESRCMYDNFLHAHKFLVERRRTAVKVQ
jgi:hypothetical protein